MTNFFKKAMYGYLPYNLRIVNSVRKTTGLTLSDASYHFEKGFKPILRPLSDLTKEIIHNGETFNPIEELVKIHIDYTERDCNLNLRYIYRERQFNVQATWDGVNGEKDYYNDDLFIMPKNYKKMKAWIVEKLFEWHFNVYNLPQDQFIDINTLED